MISKPILKSLGSVISTTLALAIFVSLVIILGTGAAIIIALIGRLTGIGKDIFIYATLFVCYDKVWDALAWVVGKIADREERKTGKEYSEHKVADSGNENT